jgi:hypothetical protein
LEAGPIGSLIILIDWHQHLSPTMNSLRFASARSMNTGRRFFASVDRPLVPVRQRSTAAC